MTSLTILLHPKLLGVGVMCGVSKNRWLDYSLIYTVNKDSSVSSLPKQTGTGLGIEHFSDMLPAARHVSFHLAFCFLKKCIAPPGLEMRGSSVSGQPTVSSPGSELVTSDLARVRSTARQRHPLVKITSTSNPL